MPSPAPDWSVTRSLGRLSRSPSARYVVTGGIGYVINLVVFVASIEALHADPYLALAAAFLANTGSNFVLNYLWTFGGEAGLGRSIARYAVLALGLLGLNYTTFHLFYSSGGLPAVPAQALAIIIGLPVGFVISRTWAFRPDPSA